MKIAMKTFMTVFSILVIISLDANGQTSAEKAAMKQAKEDSISAANEAKKYSLTQSQLNQQAGNKHQNADKELNSVYQNILKGYATDTVFIKNLKEAQRIWIQFRDAEVKMKFPDQKFSGSARPMCIAMYLEELTKTRVKTLKVWQDGIEEGDICNGSIKNK